MSLEWTEVKLKDVGKIVTGKTPKTSIEDNYGGDIPFLTPSDDMNVKIIQYTNKTLSLKGLKEVKNCLIPKNSVCVSCIGSDLGKVVLTSEDTVTNQQINSIIVNDDYDYNFIYYTMNLVGKQLNYMSKSSTAVPIINKSTFSKELIFVPPLEEQRKISSILSNIDNLIDTLNEINKNLQNLIKILYKEYFESFELDNVPDDWELVNIGSIIDIYNGYSYKGTELQESDCGMVTIKNFNRDGSFRIDGFKEIVYSNKIKKHHFINENDVLISCTDVTQDADIIGNCIMVLDKQNYDELIMSMDLVKIESKIPEINNFLLASIFKSYNFKKHILGYVNGTTVLHLDKKGIKKFKIALPKDLSELKNISERFELIYAEIQCNQKEINKLTNLRDTLLPKLMSGEIDVSQIDM